MDPHVLADSDPKRAAEVALAGLGDDWQLAGVLVDAGSNLADVGLVQQGRDRISEALAEDPLSGGIAYMAGTAETRLAHTAAACPFDWVESWRCERKRGRALLAQAGRSESLDPELRAMAWINLADDLNKTGRTHEALGAYKAALDVDPGNPVASGWVAQLIFDAVEHGWQTERSLASAHHYARLAQADLARVADVCPAEVAGQFADMPTERALHHNLDVARKLKPQTLPAFVYSQNLGLSLQIEGLDQNTWDLMPVPSGSERSSIPAIAMLNILKADYLVARELVYRSFVAPDDAPEYFETNDGGWYGARFGMARLGLRAAVDCLDRVGAAVNESFGLNVDPRGVSFRNIWRRGDDLNPAVAAQYERGNLAVAGLADLALDLAADGWLAERQAHRNAATHRFLRANLKKVTEDTGSGIVDIRPDDLGQSSIEALRAAQSAIILFALAVCFKPPEAD